MENNSGKQFTELARDLVKKIGLPTTIGFLEITKTALMLQDLQDFQKNKGEENGKNN